MPHTKPAMNTFQLACLTSLVMLAFAANSLLCRLALQQTEIDAASFSLVRLVSGALMLCIAVRWKGTSTHRQGSWPGAGALFIYVAAFSYAYISLAAGTGALLLFAAVQLTMVLAGLAAGEKISRQQSIGLTAALAGLVILVLPGIETPSLTGSLLMLASGIAWGAYSLLGRRVSDPIATTAGNFLRAAAIAIALSWLTYPWMKLDPAGLIYAALSGALASGAGYVVWYRVLREMKSITASSLQLTVPALAALGGIVFLGEPITANFMVSSIFILGGLWLVLHRSTVLEKKL